MIKFIFYFIIVFSTAISSCFAMDQEHMTAKLITVYFKNEVPKGFSGPDSDTYVNFDVTSTSRVFRMFPETGRKCVHPATFLC